MISLVSAWHYLLIFFSREQTTKEVIRLHRCTDWSFADPESFVRGGPSLTTFFSYFSYFSFISWWGEGGSKYHHKRAIISLPEKCNLNGAFRWLADDGPTMNAVLVALWFFRGSGPVLIEKKPYIIVIFQRGSGRPVPPPPPPLWICACWYNLLLFG